jgi:hypothetical protein
VISTTRVKNDKECIFNILPMMFQNGMSVLLTMMSNHVSKQHFCAFLTQQDFLRTSHAYSVSANVKLRLNEYGVCSAGS